MTQAASTPSGATRALADFAATTALEQIPQVMRERVKQCFLDFVGNSAFAALEAESSPAFRAGVQSLVPSDGPGTVVGESRRYPYEYAALLNGVYAHSLDFDDTSLFGALHPGVVVIPAALAEAERVGASGRQFLEALVVGYEIACRVGAAIGQTVYDRGFHNTSVAGIFGATAAAAKLRGMDGAAIDNAFGLAGSMAAGSMQYMANGAWNKRLHPGLAAHNALLSLAFSTAGTLGSTAAIEGRYGVLTAYSNKPTPEHLTDRLGQWWAASDIAIKPYPSCRLAHGAIDAALELRKRAMDRLHDVDLELFLPTICIKVVGEAVPNKIHPSNIVEGQFSVYFQLATAWLDGQCNWQSYERLGQSDVSKLESRITVIPAEATSKTPAILRVKGEPELTVRIDEMLGEANRPLSWQQLLEKYSGLAEPVYGKARTAEIAAWVDQLEGQKSLTDLTRLLVVGSPS